MNLNNKKVKNLSQQLSIKNILVLTVLVVSVTMISCSSSQKESNTEQVNEQIQALKTISEPVQQIEQGEVEQNIETSIEENTANSISTQANNPLAPELNPAHGEPFHRCDIPVGSPLNSAAPVNSIATENKTEISPVVQNTANLISTQANTTAPELNPPHGEPFHRCDIPVGSPLASAAPASAATTNSSPTIQRTGLAPTIENAARLNNSSRNNTAASTLANSVPPKINPPHGQPFHRCDIAVGSPLPVN